MIISVRFEDRHHPGQFSNQEYNYKTSLVLVPGDTVVCPTVKGEGRGVVSRVNVAIDEVPVKFRDSLRRIEKMCEAPPEAAKDAGAPGLMPAT